VRAGAGSGTLLGPEETGALLVGVSVFSGCGAFCLPSFFGGWVGVLFVF
jgi:hypothetical protein